MRTNRGIWKRLGMAHFMLIAVMSPIACKTIHHRGDPGSELECCETSVDGSGASMSTLAKDLDKLEWHIEWYGSAIAKAPDVWGEARLTFHRDEFEGVMSQQKDEFAALLSGSISRSDQAYLAQALALSASVQPTKRGSSSETTLTVDAPEFKQPEGNELSTTREVFSNDIDKVKQRSIDGNLASTTVGLEPTIVLAQQKRYLDYLHQIRRVNEGDDTSDSPGYALNLVRIPVSILPGKHTDKGHGADISMTISPLYGDDLLPNTFRDLVMNDLIFQLGFPLAQFLSDDSQVSYYLNPEHKPLLEGLELLRLIRNTPTEAEIKTLIQSFSKEDQERLTKVILASKETGTVTTELLNELNHLWSTAPSPDQQPIAPQANLMPQIGTKLKTKFDIVQQKVGTALSNISKIEVKLNLPSLSFSNGLEDKLPFPTSQLLDVYGITHAYQIASSANDRFRDSKAQKRYVHLPDIQNFIKEELEAAFQFLAQPESAELWEQFCTQELVQAIRLRQRGRIEELRERYRDKVAEITLTKRYRQKDQRPYLELMHFSTTAALSWTIIVDSALLNARLIEDMQRIAKVKNCPCPPDWQPYFLPSPPMEARKAFAEYVRCRWPIHVFALDPNVDEQNIADTFSSRREMQLALSIAFVNGQINANSLTRYTRRLEAEYETIALNRTQVGYSHGENHFGWRFYPRLQTPDTESNLTVLVRDQIIGGPRYEALLRDRRLEPGPRECVALVLMPSFLSHVQIDMTTNWFSLANPKHKVGDLSYATRLSRAVQSIKKGANCVADAECYRPGELERLQRRLEQLEARLPLQTQLLSMPTLNNLGGFEMFNRSNSALAPELYGWYGAPGVDPKKDTTIFLVGNHFSVHQTHVIVGNSKIEIDAKKLLSRQVMEVTIPANQVIPLKYKDREWVEIHVATPYGVTRELLVPAKSDSPTPPPEPTEGYSIAPTKVTFSYQWSQAANGKWLYDHVKLIPGTQGIEIDFNDASGSVPNRIEVRLVFPSAVGEVSVSGEITANNGAFQLDAAKLQDLLTEVAKQLNASPLLSPENDVFKTGMRTKLIRITPVSMNHSVKGITQPEKIELIGNLVTK